MLGQNTGLSVMTTASGMVGGVSKAVSAHLTIASISLGGVIDVAFYAVISASVGYCVKLIYDYLLRDVFKKGRKP